MKQNKKLSFTVLVITEESQRYYWDSAFFKAADLGIDIWCFDTSQFPSQKTGFTITMTEDGQIEGSIQANRYKQDKFSETENLNIKDIDLAWYLRPGSFKKNTFGSKMESKFARDEAKHALISLLDVIHVPWINHPKNIQRADNSKLYQQMLAAKVGLTVPKTIISNDSKRMKSVFSEQDNCLVKSMGLSQIETEEPMYIYSNIVPVSEIDEAVNSIAKCPLFAQEYIQKKYEYRVVIAGDQCAACRISSQDSKKTMIDWRRYDFENVSHKLVTLPDEVTKKLLEFMKLAQLNYGMIDLIRTPTDNFVFLEVNPSGQWGWLEQLAKVPVPDLICKMFLQFKKISHF